MKLRAILSGHTAFLAVLIVAFSSTLAPLQAVYLVLAFLVVLIHLDSFRSATNMERALIGMLILTVAICLPVSALRHPPALVHFMVTIISVGAAFVLTRDKERYLVASRATLLMVQGGVFAYLSVKGFDNFPLENMIFDSSSNGITSYLIILQVNYSAFNFILHRRASNVTAVLTLIICIVGYGRGSILAGALIVVINILSYISWRSYLSAMFRIVAVLSVSLVVALFYSEDIADFVEANTKIGSGLYDEARERILYEYIAKIDATTLVTGAEYDGTSIPTDFRGNPHNSYVRAHHIFGLPYLLALMIFPLTLLWTRQAWSVKLFCAGMLVAVLFRATTEPVLFPTVFDFYFFAFCFGLTGQANAAAAPAPAPAPAAARPA